MSALAGLISLRGAPVARERLERMAAAAKVLGPDATGIWHSDHAGFVHLKLATTPESIHEQQPLLDQEAQLVIAFDGRLDNRDDLFRELGQRDSPARSDSELALAMFKLLGERCFEKLVGDYALAIWNIRERQLVCARSLLGWRPFSWWCDGSTFGFATDVKQLFAGGGIEQAAYEPMLGEILALKMTHATETIWKGIHRLQPGSALSLKQDGRPRTWLWHQGPFPEIKLASEDEYADRFRQLFDQALKACMRSTTPVAVQLSGGLDSSSVVCRAAELFRNRQVDKLVQPVSAVFPGKDHNESDWIDMVAAKTGIEPKRFIPGPFDWDTTIAWTKETLYLPLRPNAQLMNSLAAQLPNFGSRVLLTGEGGDDWLRGSFSHFPDLLRRGRILQLGKEGLIFNDHGNYASRIRRTAGNSLGPLLRPRLKEMAIYGSQFTYALPSWINSDWARQIQLDERVRHKNETPRMKSLAQTQRYQRYLSIRHHVVYDNAYHQMASHKIEIRHPFHDRRLTEFVLRAPGHLFRRGELKKYILRQAMKGILPEGIRARTTKAAFVDPFVDSLQQFISRRPISELSSVKNGWIDGKLLQGMFEENLAANRRGQRSGEHTASLSPLWFAIAIDIWMEHAL